MRYSTEFIEKVTEASNLVDLVSMYTQLKPVGGGFMGRCPFPDHPEKTPSFSVSEAKQVFNCFGCHKKGNIFSFLAQYNGMSFPEAIEYLADRAGIALPKKSEMESSAQDQANLKKKQMFAATLVTAQFYFENLRRFGKDSPVRKYVESRGLSSETIETFQIGYAPSDWDQLSKLLESKKISLPLADEARLVRPRKEGKSGYYDLFRDRLMFPIRSLVGDVVGFGGRIISTGEPKYLNSPESFIFHKGKILYGLDQTARYIRAEDQVIIVEGYMDAVGLFQAGLKNVAATMGTALTFDHCKAISRMTKNVLVLFDGDSAGQEAAERSLPILLSAGLLPRGLILPDGQDPDDFVKNHGPDALKALIEKAKDLYSILLEKWTKDFRGEASQKVQICDLLAPLFDQIQDPRLRQLYGEETAKRLGVEANWLAQALHDTRNSAARKAGLEPNSASSGAGTKLKLGLSVSETTDSALTASSAQTPSQWLEEEQIRLEGISNPEKLLLSLIFSREYYFLKAQEWRLHEISRHAGFKSLLEKAFSTYRQHPEKFDKLASLFVSFIDHPEWIIGGGGLSGAGAGANIAITEKNASGSITIPEFKDEFERTPEEEMSENKLFQDCVRRLKEEDLKLKAEALAQELKNSPTTEKWEQYRLIQKDRQSLNKEKA